MNLYIKLSNNKPIDHPYTEENLRSAYPDVDLENLPPDWAKFIRVQRPKLGPYEVAEVFYEWDGDVIKDTWYVYPMSDEEKKAKQERVKQSWKEDNGPENWIFDEERCVHVPPVPMPTDGKPYIWVQDANAWVERKLNLVEGLPTPPPYPTDGKNYKFNFDTYKWELKN